MANRNMALDVIVRLKDLLSSPLRRLQASLSGIADVARKIGAVGAAVGALSFLGPIQDAAAFQQKLLDISVTQGLVGQEAFKNIAEMKGMYQDLARQVGISSQDIAGAAGQMIAAGLDKSLVDASIGNIARTATAANADIKDIASVATSLMQSLKVPAGELGQAMDKLVVGGKLGSFELKDMAKYFPVLTGQVAKLGVTGQGATTQLAAMLQVARMGTSDPAEAANNLNNFLSKITSQETIKNFEKMNVDIMAVMQNAVIQGISPIEAVIQKISKLTGVSGSEVEAMLKKAKDNGIEGADALEQVGKQLTAISGAGALSGLFSDMQVNGFLIPMLANMQKYKSIRDEIAKADGSTTRNDTNTQMQGLNKQLTIFKDLMSQISDEIGSSFGEWLPTLNEGIGKALDAFRAFNKETGGFGRQLLVAGGGAILAAGAIGALGIAIPIITAGFAALFAPLRAITGLMRMLSRSSAGVGGLADQLGRVNEAATKAAGIGRPSMWSMLFGVGNAASLASAIPSDANELQKFMDGNKKQWDGYNNWLEQNVGTPRSWLGLDKASPAGSASPADRATIDQQRKDLAALTNDWPFAAQQDMREFIAALSSGGVDATAKAGNIGQQIKDMLQISASPDIQTGEMQKAFDLAKDLAGKLREINTIQVRPSIGAASNDNAAGIAGRSALPAVQSGVSAAQAPVQMQGSMMIGLDPGLRIVNADSGVDGVRVQSTANTGRVIGRN
ncbi:phage tail tape measure protein, TP901 family, core region [Rhizobium sp. RU35A]|uniref:phage tail tape measure protein n=1 Tax=Rhizobium sp. RU35A TaxID=1907414 RepID=UPI000956C827|nr:phage tail tape measure protein [Rhizobium sp. RU35A]SIQ23431.1 phage tail tape measure protein, TP901 family, core region [Rhizobium sp. RU35A]